MRQIALTYKWFPQPDLWPPTSRNFAVPQILLRADEVIEQVDRPGCPMVALHR